jgi:restriction endonuclease S subunit
VGNIAKDKRDPSKEPEEVFQYIDIAAVDVVIGAIVNPQDVEGSEAPSRARKVVRAFDILVSTCRPTRGAIAVVGGNLHNQIASTAFSVVRAHADINPFYLHYALRLPSTLEQFRKWSTGSSYPAILDTDVKKTVIPVPDIQIQEEIAEKVMASIRERAKIIGTANETWTKVLSEITRKLSGNKPDVKPDPTPDQVFEAVALKGIQKISGELPPLRTDNNL